MMKIYPNLLLLTLKKDEIYTVQYTACMFLQEPMDRNSIIECICKVVDIQLQKDADRFRNIEKHPEKSRDNEKHSET